MTKLCISEAILKYPHHLPIYVNPRGVEMKKRRFLVKRDSTFGQFIIQLKQYVTLKYHQSFICFINDMMVPITANMGELYEEHKDGLGIMTIDVGTENVFG